VRGTRRFGAVATLVVVGWVAATGVAAAHDELVSSKPVDGQAVVTSPAEVELEFAGALQSLGDQSPIVVTTSDGTVVSDGGPDVDGTNVRQSLAPSLPDGEYQVAYRVVSSDGHLVTGTTRFFVGPLTPAPDQTPESSPADRADGSSDPGGDGAEQGDGVPGAVLAVVGGIAVLVVAVLVLRRNRDRQQP